MTKIKIPALIIFLLIVLPPVHSIYAQIRTMEPVILTGTDLSAITGIPVDQVHLFVYKDSLWKEIPMQIDERSINGSLFESDDEIWDDNDELIFQPQDGGMSVSPEIWINNDDSKNYSRLKMLLYDPVENDSNVVYLYRSSTIGDTISTTYITYYSENDEIFTTNYKMGFDSDKKFWDELRINEDGSYSNDLIDRQKTRIKGKIGFSSYSLTENDYNLTDFFYKAGKIRVSIKTEGEFSVLGVSQQVTGIGQFYKSFFAAPDNEIDIHYSVSMLRNSIDLTADAIGSIVSDENNDSLSVDGSSDPVVNDDISVSRTSNYWVKMKFSNSSLVTVGNFSGISNTNKLYYYDNSSGGAGDETSDTGDMVSYGDIGLMFDNPASGSHNTISKTYAGIDVDLSGLACQLYFDNPLETTISSETFVQTKIEEDAIFTPSSYNLLQNFPNPFNPSTSIIYSLPAKSKVDIKIFDLLGKEVVTLVNDNQEAKHYKVIWDAKDRFGNSVPSGMYLYRIVAKSGNKTFVKTRKLLLMR